MEGGRADAGSAEGGRCGTGTMVWECGVVLAQYLNARPQLLEGLRARHRGASGDRAAGLARSMVLELGAGTGVAGLVTA